MATTVASFPTRYRVEDKPEESVFETFKEFLRMLLRGCFHRHKSRPFTLGRMTCRICTGCGARRRFDLDGWEMYGPYFFGSAAPDDEEHERRRPTLAGDKSNVCLLRAA